MKKTSILLFMYLQVALLTGDLLFASVVVEDRAYKATITRDIWGVPHVFGKTDADAAFGIAFAHSQDDIKNLTDNFLVLRLSKMYGLTKGDKTILDEAANLLNQKKEVLAASDQYFNPTFIDDLVKAIIDIQEKDLKGYINVCAPETWSRFEMWTQLAQMMNKNINLIKKINLYDIPVMKGRPLNTSMVCNRLNKETDSTFTPLKDAINIVANNYKKFCKFKRKFNI